MLKSLQCFDLTKGGQPENKPTVNVLCLMWFYQINKSNISQTNVGKKILARKSHEEAFTRANTVKALRWQKESNTLWKLDSTLSFERITDLFSEGSHCVKLWCRELLQDNHTGNMQRTCKEHAKLRHDAATKPQKCLSLQGRQEMFVKVTKTSNW